MVGVRLSFADWLVVPTVLEPVGDDPWPTLYARPEVGVVVWILRLIGLNEATTTAATSRPCRTAYRPALRLADESIGCRFASVYPAV